ncbi:unnamed protein product [Owenia fusiformis]|uniref:C2H2-type domain-containing protein n=1 Tax=Owenia fusiformis TaxID=6347 RepID=A0A8S4N1G2_OWEFU|nr:unnamed protein product [Owenia fusiformis]
MKYVRSAPDPAQQNIMAVQVDDQVFYKTVKDIEPGEEMLLYARDAVYPENDLHTMKGATLDEERVHPCQQCGEVFRSKVALRRHETYVCNNSNAIFSSINKEFKENNQLPATMESDNTSASMRDDVSFTGSETDSKSSLPASPRTSHQYDSLYSAGRSDFPCENCDRVFADPSNLQRHIRSHHLGARSHACTECGKTFATSSGLKQHQHIHSSVKPFQCEVCLKAYTQFSNLCRHKRMHADCRQQIKCKDCGQAFSTVTSLSKHKRFCEGAIRNGSARYNFSAPPAGSGSSERKSSPSFPAQPPNNPALAAASAFMNLYGPRPPFPFFPPIGPSGFPLLPPGHPLAAMAMLPRANLPTAPQRSPDTPVSAKTEPHSRDNSDAGSEASDLSDREKLDEKPLASTPKATLISPVQSPKSEPSITSSRSETSTPVDFSIKVKEDVKEEENEESDAMDLSKPTSPAAGGDMPLDLSIKTTPKEDIPTEVSRKTHIFGEDKPEPPKKPVATPTSLHYAYPHLNPMLLAAGMQGMQGMQGAQMTKDKMRMLQDVSKMMAFSPRFNMPSPIFPSSKPPMMKMSKSPESFNFPSPNKKVSNDRYACKFCGKIFPRSANLTRHLRTHTGEQPYKCKYCERSFSISSNLQRHVRNIHNKEKPYRCPLCDRSFGQQTNLDRHLKKHETEGLNVTDSPINDSVEDKDDAYFDDIRNFISEDGVDDEEDTDKHSKVSEYSSIDSSYSITTQLAKQQKMRLAEHSDEGSPNKRPRIENNNGRLKLDSGYADDDCDDRLCTTSPVQTVPVPMAMTS